MSNTITMYGIKNCDTIKKAQKWLQTNDIDFQFHDYRKDGIDLAMLQTFAEQLGWENLLNKRGTTYRNLTDEQKAALTDQSSDPKATEQLALDLLVQNPAMVKRPVLVADDKYQLGFKADQYQAFFNL